MDLPWLRLALAFFVGAELYHQSVFTLAALITILAAAAWRLRLPLLAVLAFALCCGAIRVCHFSENKSNFEEIESDSRHLGTIQSVAYRGGQARALVELDEAPGELVQMGPLEAEAGLGPGARVLLNGALRELRAASNPGGFDAQKWGERRNIKWIAGKNHLILEPSRSIGMSFIAIRLAARRALLSLTRKEGGALLHGFLLGDKAAIPDDAQKALMATGLGHLLAVSGLHVAGFSLAIVALCSAVARRLGVVYPRRVASIFAFPCVFGFVALADFPISACRAGVMVGGILGAEILLRSSNAKNLLGLAAFLIIAESPESPHEVSFQLSFAAVAALITLSPKNSNKIKALLATSLIAWAATAPLQAWHFGTFAPMSLVANLTLTPLASTLVVPLGLFGLFLAPLTSWPLEAAAALTEFLVYCAKLIIRLGLDQQIVGQIWSYALATPILWLIGRRINRPKLGVVFAFIACSTSMLLANISRIKGESTVEYISVGQGDAILLKSRGDTLLVDSGPDFEGRELLNFFRNQGIRHLDRLILTHNHSDHYAGIAALLSEVKIEKVFYNGRISEESGWLEMRDQLLSHNVPFEPFDGRDFDVGDLHLRFIDTDQLHQKSENNASLVFHVQGPGCDLLLTGDIGQAVEAEIVKKYEISNICALQAPHHGSGSSNSPVFMNTLNPSVVVVSAGYKNRLNLPSPKTVQAYEERRIPMWRTDLDGRILIQLGKNPYIEAFHRERVPLIRPTAHNHEIEWDFEPIFIPSQDSEIIEDFGFEPVQVPSDDEIYFEPILIPQFAEDLEIILDFEPIEVPFD